MDQPVGRPVRGELVVSHVEPGAVGQVHADVPGEQDPPAQAGEVRLARPVLPGEAAPGKPDDAGEEKLDERLEHVESRDVPDAGDVELRLAEPPPVAQHLEEDPAGGFLAGGAGARALPGGVREAAPRGGRSGAVLGGCEIDLRENLYRGPPARLDDADVVLRAQAAVPDLQDRPEPVFRIGPPSGEGEIPQIPLLVLGEAGQLVVLPDDQRTPARAGAAAPGPTGQEVTRARGRHRQRFPETTCAPACCRSPTPPAVHGTIACGHDTFRVAAAHHGKSGRLRRKADHPEHAAVGRVRPELAVARSHAGSDPRRSPGT